MSALAWRILWAVIFVVVTMTIPALIASLGLKGDLGTFHDYMLIEILMGVSLVIAALALGAVSSLFDAIALAPSALHERLARHNSSRPNIASKWRQ